MKKFDLGQAITILANLGVIAGIVFLALEIRVNTSAVRSASIQAITDGSADALHALAADQELASLRLAGDSDPTSLSEIEAFQYRVYYRQHWLRFQNAYFQRRFDALDAAVWGTYERIICADINRPGVEAGWPFHAEVLDPEFVEFIESCRD